MSKAIKAVIPAAGMGSRFLPVTKSLPKEMLPIVDKPTIQYVVEELASSGIKDIIIVTDSSKTAIEDHFDHLDCLENKLISQGKKDRAKEIRKIADLGNFIFIRQKGPYGNGTPALCAEPLVKNEPFIYIWGDEFIYANPPRVKQMLDIYNKYKCSVISAIEVDKKEVSRYGIARVNKIENNIHQIKEIVEKPSSEKAPSRLAAHGAYLLTPTIFKFLKNQETGKGGELWLVDAINKLAQEEKVLACVIKKGQYYDIGNKLGYLKANIDFGLKHPEVKKDLKKYLKNKNE